jgi:peptidoglycan/LPS O-acetylase OafA/YrhL
MTPLLDRERTVFRSDSIDSMRAFLSIYVIFSHAYLWGPLTQSGTAAPLRWFGHSTVSTFQAHGETNPAVVAFIVLSGYCIHRNGARRGRWDIRGYVVKRAFRIWPVYLAATVVGALLFEVAIQSHAHVTRVMSATSDLTAGCVAAKLSGIASFVPSARLYGCSYQGNAPLATVAAEIGLYVVYGMAMWLMLRAVSGWVLTAVATAAFVGCLALVLANSNLDAWWFNGSVVAFLPLWWLGALLVGEIDPRPLAFAGVGAGVGWALMTLYLRSHRSVPVEEARLLALGLIVGIGIRFLDHRVRHLPRPVTLIGRAGYSIYAFHAPILILLIAMSVQWGIVVGAAVLVGVLSFYVFEGPLTQRGRELARRGRSVSGPNAQPQDGLA